MAVTDCPNSSCSSRAIIRRSRSICWSIQLVNSWLSDSFSSARMARRSVSICVCNSSTMRLNAVPMAAASVPANGGNFTSRRPPCNWFNALTIFANGLSVWPTSQNTRELTNSNSSRPETASTFTLSQASSTARDALDFTINSPPENAIVCINGNGAISRPNHCGASRPVLYVDGGERCSSRPAGSSKVMSFDLTRPMPCKKITISGRLREGYNCTVRSSI